MRPWITINQEVSPYYENDYWQHMRAGVYKQNLWLYESLYNTSDKKVFFFFISQMIKL